MLKKLISKLCGIDDLRSEIHDLKNQVGFIKIHNELFQSDANAFRKEFKKCIKKEDMDVIYSQLSSCKERIEDVGGLLKDIKPIKASLANAIQSVSRVNSSIKNIDIVMSEFGNDIKNLKEIVYEPTSDSGIEFTQDNIPILKTSTKRLKPKAVFTPLGK